MKINSSNDNLHGLCTVRLSLQLSVYLSMKNAIIKFGYLFSILLLLISCGQDQDIQPDEPGDSGLPDIGAEAANIPQWIYEEMSFFYYWSGNLPTSEPSGEEEPEVYFSSLLDPQDVFSYISDDAEAIKEEITGTIVAMGFSTSFGFFTNSDNLFAVVEYVYPNSPAAKAGLKRGDIILKIDGTDLSSGNFGQLGSRNGFSVTLGDYNGQGISLSDEVVEIERGTIELDPVIHYEVKEVDNRKVGYLVYVDFLQGENNKWLNSLGTALSDLKAEGIEALILDLRYNPGGEIAAASYLASAIAPLSAVENREILVEFEYNQDLSNFFLERQGEDSPNLRTRLTENQYSLDLSELYVLTTRTTASASELVINGLKPYMDVTMIGEPTFGKFYGSYVLYDQNDPPEHNWAIVPVVLKYANALGETDFRNGLNPDVFIQDNILEARPFGDIEDPMLATAINLISGEDVSNARMASAKPYQPVYDMQKINLRNTKLFVGEW